RGSLSGHPADGALDVLDRGVGQDPVAGVEDIGAGVPLPDWRVCYQSRVGPMKWIGPSTVEEIHIAGEQGVGLLLSPIAFVSEHIETLVELDHEYAELAENQGVAPYLRAPALGVDQAFIAALAQTVTHALARGGGAAPEGAWLCPAGYGKCGRSTQGA
ncbi:MAG: ferrochelatase, partial [Phenylobacterium sp.]|nr:ferrochelatase [Phenylobacterium sp.]